MLLEIQLTSLPRVEMLGQVRRGMGWGHTVERVQPNLMVIVREGDMRFTTPAGVFPLKRDDFLFLPSGTAYYRVESQAGCRYEFIHFLLDHPAVSLGEGLRPHAETEKKAVRPRPRPYSLPLSEPESLMLPLSGALGREAEKVWSLIAECDMDRYEITPNRKLRIDLRFASLLCMLEVSAQQAPVEAFPATLSRILFYLNEHYMEPVTLSSLSENFHLSRQYIMRLFRRHLQTTVTHYIQQVKLAHAQELLRYSTFRVQEVADMLGFSSAYYFCRLFRAHFGITPTAFINSVKEGRGNAVRPPDRNGRGDPKPVRNDDSCFGEGSRSK